MPTQLAIFILGSVISVQLLWAEVTFSPNCLKAAHLETMTDGHIEITFDHIEVTRGDSKPFVRCRMMVTALPIKSVTAEMGTAFDLAGDSIAAKLSIGTFIEKKSAFRWVPFAKDLKVFNLSVEPPKLTSNSTIQLEAMINYRLDQASKVQASIQKIIIYPALQERS